MTTLSYDATGAARLAHEQHLPDLLEDKVATRIFAKDPTLWGPDAEAEASVPLPGYTHLQRAVVSSLGMWWAAWAEGFIDDAQLARLAGKLGRCGYADYLKSLLA